MSELATRCDLAVVGAGFSGRMLLAQLHRLGRLPARVVLIDPGLAQHAPGLAWTDASGLWSANVPAGNLSAWPDDPAHFVRWWAQRRGVAVEELSAAFAPRAAYGEYLQAQLDLVLQSARDDGQVQLRAAQVRAMNPDGAGWRLQLDDGTSMSTRKVVLATGFGARRTSSGALCHALDALDPAVLNAVPATASVLLVGSGLTAVDALQKLAVNGYGGQLVMLSRHALLPSAHAEVAAPRRAWERAELGQSVRDALSAVRGALVQVQRTGGDWRSVIDGLRPHNNAVWRGWDPVERARFLRHVRAWWDVHRHRAAGDVLAQIHEFMATHDVQRRAGFLEAIAPVDGGLLARWRERGSTCVHSQLFDVVLDATSRQPLETPLIAQLRRDGLLVADRQRLDLCCDEHEPAAPLDAQGRRLRGVYLLGPLLQGRDWESTAVPELRQQAAQLAEHLGRSSDE